MKKWLKWIGMICLIPIILVLLTAILLYVPPIQNKLVQVATKYASEATGMQIGIDRVRLSFPVNLAVCGIEVVTPPDTLATIERLIVHVNPFRIANQVIGVKALTLQEVEVNTGSFTDGMAIKGYVKSLSAKADRISLAEETVHLNHIILSDATILLRIDSLSQEKDTTNSEPVNWKLSLDKAALKNVSFAMQMPADSFALHTHIANAGMTSGVIDLGQSQYSIERFNLAASHINYDGDYNQSTPGFDPMHIRLRDINTTIHSVFYQGLDIQADILSFALKEQSGLAISSLNGIVKTDSSLISVPGLSLQTDHSTIKLSASVPWSSLEEQPQGNMEATLKASIGKNDIFAFLPDLSADFKRSYPEKPLNLALAVNGNVNSLNLKELKAELPDAFSANALGGMTYVMDSIHRSADIHLTALTGNLNFVSELLSPEQRKRIHIPSGMELAGDIQIKEQEYLADINIIEDKAVVSLDGRYHSLTESYQAALKIDNLEPVHFLPKDSLLLVAASLTAEGKGFDPFAQNTWATIEGKISNFTYGEMALSDITLDASLKENQASLNINSNDSLANLHIIFDGTITETLSQGMLIMDVDSLDLYGLDLLDSPFRTSFQLFAEGRTDLKEYNQLDVSLGNWEIRTEDQRFQPKLLTLKAQTDSDTTRVSLHAGDLGIILTGNAGLNRMVEQFGIISDEINRQLEQDSTINIAALNPSLPDMNLSITAKRDNPIYNILRRYYINYTDVNIYASTSPEEGIRLDAGVYAFARDTFLIDTIRATVRPDSSGLLYTGEVVKNRYRQQLPFSAYLHGSIKNNYADAELLYTNHLKETGILLGIRAIKESAGITFQLYPDEPIIAFNKFKLNADNYLYLNSLKDIDANIRFEGQENAFVWLHSIDGGGDYPEQHIELSNLNLGTITTGFADLPNMGGILSADLQYAPTEETFLVVADAHIDELIYEKGRVGEIMFNAVYLPLENSIHQVDAHFYHDQNEIITATAMYNAAQTQNNVEGTLDLTTLPLAMVNAFIPENRAEMQGALNGHMSITGSSASPMLNGYMQLDTSSVYLGMADTRLRFDDKKITVDNSLISFNKYNIYATGNNPFIIDGHINMADFSRMMADLRLTANNMQVLDARRTRESMVYGKLYMDFNSTVKGPLSNLVVRGDAHLLGGTDVTYILTESPLTVQDRMEGLVTFTSFTDTLTRQRRSQEQLALGGIDMLMVIHIDPNVQFRADLTPDQSNYVEVEGGGDLSFQYTPQGDMILNGRYTFSEGIVNYSLPVIPLKAFNIHNGSYVQWDGELMNPLINVIATERMRVSINDNDGGTKRVNFDVGISVQDHLDNMQMSFIIDAENTEIQTELAAMGDDERTRQAVYMMVTGTYMAAGGANMNLGGALGNFLVGEINNIAGDALKSVDINIGLDTYETGGNSQTDFTFSFAKRFYNDRIRVSIGGKVSTGESLQEEQSFLDNFAAEYLLDQAGTKTIKVFYDRNYESLLDGEVIETGVGLVLRKKVLHLRELFDFRKKKVTPKPEENEDEQQEKQAFNTYYRPIFVLTSQDEMEDE
ncbi:translocation/assembly module TamB [Parabacteroides sp. OttesenSCG-928-G07]|nr:translocation/assembly module TamB [Parabacteroides sp. OttesenSCG-928-G21]MDL2278834.1 translocation/assembly module TamB [Parabacteroides sp. OttesenSCG-928-G07]